MTNRPSRILLIGCGHIATSVLNGLLPFHQRDIEIVGVFPWSNTLTGKTFYDDSERAFRKLIQTLQLPMVECEAVNHYSFTGILESLKPDILLFACWGEIIKKHVLKPDAPYQVINCHPSLLPAHRGPNPYASSILSQESHTGVTFHIMSPKIDEGPVILQEAVPITRTDTGESLRDKCCLITEKMLPALVRWIQSDTRESTPQDHSLKSYYPQLQLSDAAIHWEADPQSILTRQRALHPWLQLFAWLICPPANPSSQQYLRFFTVFQHLTLQPAESLPNAEMLRASQIMDDNRLSEMATPGTLLCNHHGQLWVASANPGHVFVSEHYKLYWLNFFLPPWLSRLLLRIGLRPVWHLGGPPIPRYRFVNGA